jgi:hypothetical protein
VVTVQANGGAILDADGAVTTNVTAFQAILSGSFIAAVANPLDTSVDSLNTNTGAANGNQNIQESNGLLELNMNAGATGDINLTLLAGAVLSSDAATDIIGDVVSVVAPAGFGSTSVTPGNAIETSVVSLAVTSNAGSQFILESDGLVLSSLTAGGAGNDVSLISTTGDITVVTVSAADDINLTAGGGNIFDDGVNGTVISGDLLTLRAVRAIGAPGATGMLDTTVASLDAVTTGAGPFAGAPSPGIWLTDANDLVVVNALTTGDGVILIDAATGNLDAQSVTANGTGRNVRLRALAGNLHAGSITAAGDIVSLIASGSITDGDAGNDVTALSLLLSAGVGGAGDPLDTTVSNVAWNTGTGSIDLVNSGALTIASITAFGLTVNGGSGTGYATVTTLSPLTALSNVIMAGDVTLTAGETDDDPACADDLTINGGVTIQSTGGNVTLQAGDDIILGSGSTLSAAATVSLVAGFGDLDGCGEIFDNGATFNVGVGLAFCVVGDFNVGAINMPGKTVSIRSETGAILDGNGAAVNVAAAALAMRAATGIGTGPDGAIETVVSNLEARSDAGDIVVSNTGDLTIGGVTPAACVGPLTGVVAGGNVNVATTGTLNVNVAGDIVASGVLPLLAADFSDGAGGTILDGFTASGLWHATTNEPGASLGGHSSPEYAYYGIDATDTYDNGAANSGNLTSGPIAIPAVGPAQLHFNYRLQSEAGTPFDAAEIQVSTDGGTTFPFLIASNGGGQIPQTLKWSPLTFDLGAFAGQTIQIRFHFDTVDANANALLGWQVDDVVVVAGTGPGNTTLSADDMVITQAISAVGDIVTLQQAGTTARTIDLGTNTAGALGLTDSELDLVTANILKVGRTDNTGDITITAAISPLSSNTLFLRSGGVITDAAAGALLVPNVGAQAGTGVTLDNTASTFTNFEAEATTGGITVVHNGNLTIGGVTADLRGLRVDTSGDITVTNAGSITLTDNDGVATVGGGSTSGNVTLSANGAASDVTSTVNGDAITASRGSISVNAGRDIRFGTAGANFDNDVRASGNVTFNAGRDITIDGFSDISSDDFGQATGGSVLATAGLAGTGNITVSTANGNDATFSAGGTALGNVSLTALAGGTITNQNQISSNSGAVTLRADFQDLQAGSEIVASQGTVDLRANTIGVSADLGSAAAGLNFTQAELNTITANVLQVTGALNVNVSQSITLNPAQVPTLSLVATIGAITESTGAEQPDLTVTNLSLQAATGIGAANDLDTAVANLAFNNTTGLVDIINTGGGTPEVQSVTISGPSGSFTLTFNGQTTSSLPFNATASQIQDALNALSSIGGVGGGVSVVRSGSNFIVGFGGSLSGLNQPLLTASVTGATTVIINTVQQGSPPSPTLTIASVAGSGPSTNTGTTTNISNTSAIVFAANATTAGDTVYTAGETATVAVDILVLNPGVTVEATAGNLTLQAGDEILLLAGSTARASGTVTQNVGFGNLDNFGGATIQGTIDAGAGTPALIGGAEVDTVVVNFTAGANLPDGLAYQSGGGNDSLTVSDAGGAAGHTYGISASGVTRDSGAAISTTGVEDVTTNGGNASDTFNVTADANVAFNIDGGLPSAPVLPGDTLSYFGPGTVTSTGVGAGTIAGAGVQPVDFVDIETLATSIATITANPASQTIVAGGTAFFTAAAFASSPLTVQWQISNNGGASWSNLSNGGNFSGVTTTTLTVSQALTNLTGSQFRAVFTTTADFVSTATAAATLTVNSVYAYTAYINAYSAYFYAYYAYTTSNGSTNSYLAYINAASALTWASYANYYSSIGQTATAVYYASLAQSYSLVAAYYSYLVYAATGNIYAYYAWYFATNSYYYSYYTSQGY